MTSLPKVTVEERDDGMSSGLLAPRRGLDGKDSAFDMKSLDKHIEAVFNILSKLLVS
jgi:hypothetical protein